MQTQRTENLTKTSTTTHNQPTPPETIRVAFGRKQFNIFLRLIHDTPGDSWKAAQIELKGSALASSKYDRNSIRYTTSRASWFSSITIRSSA